MKVIVTGGASFIGSHLVDRLLDEGHNVTVLDDYSSGSAGNLSSAFEKGVQIRQINLRNEPPLFIAKRFKHADIVFHLAADHGGRGYVETKQVNCSNNFAIDNNVFQACRMANVGKVVFASSGCIYPLGLQSGIGDTIYLKEYNDTIKGAYEPDGLYGLAKLAGELTLKEMYREHGIESVSCRFFTVYGPRAKENHAIMSFIARAFIKSDPWTVWGDGTQIRNWTYVDDIVNGLMLSMEVDGCEALNLGTTEQITVKQAVEKVIGYTNSYYYTGYFPKIEYDTTKPTGPMVRVADNSKYLNLGGKPLTSFDEGLKRTMDWYFSTHNVEDVRKNLERLLIDRK